MFYDKRVHLDGLCQVMSRWVILTVKTWAVSLGNPRGHQGRTLLGPILSISCSFFGENLAKWSSQNLGNRSIEWHSNSNNTQQCVRYPVIREQSQKHSKLHFLDYYIFVIKCIRFWQIYITVMNLSVSWYARNVKKHFRRQVQNFLVGLYTMEATSMGFTLCSRLLFALNRAIGTHMHYNFSFLKFPISNTFLHTFSWKVIVLCVICQFMRTECDL